MGRVGGVKMGVNLDFNDKTVVVVGGTSGINRGIAEGFARCGASLAVASRSQAKVEDTVQALKEAGAKTALGRAFDVRDAAGTSDGMS